MGAMRRRAAGLLPLLMAAGCSDGGGLGDEATGSAVAYVTTVPVSVQCVRLTLRGVTRGFDVAAGASSAALDLGPQASGSVQVTAQAFDVACAAVTPMHTPTWVSEPVSAAVMAGFTTNIALTLRPNVRATASVDFLNPAVAIAVGAAQSYAVLQDGSVRGWGDNRAGQLGDGTTTSRSAPTALGGLPAVRRVAAGARHTCALTAAGTVYCWGYNDDGELGDGTRAARPTPARVDLGIGPAAFVAELAAGSDHTCVVKSFSNSVYCWGDNTHGQIGDGSGVDRLRPTATADVGERLYDLAAAGTATCAVNGRGGGICWGSNGGQRFSPDPPESALLDPYWLNPFRWLARLAPSASFDDAFVCGLDSAGAVSCGGGNQYGQLGDGTTIGRATDAVVVGLPEATSLSVGTYGACAALRDGTAWCWGVGPLGSGETRRASSPVQVRGLRGVVEVAVGHDHACARLADGTVWCWGSNDYGQLGDGTLRNRLTPVRVNL